jgi:hypothetical protein
MKYLEMLVPIFVTWKLRFTVQVLWIKLTWHDQIAETVAYSKGCPIYYQRVSYDVPKTEQVLTLDVFGQTKVSSTEPNRRCLWYGVINLSHHRVVWTGLISYQTNFADSSLFLYANNCSATNASCFLQPRSILSVSQEETPLLFWVIRVNSTLSPFKIYIHVILDLRLDLLGSLSLKIFHPNTCKCTGQ